MKKNNNFRERERERRESVDEVLERRKDGKERFGNEHKVTMPQIVHDFNISDVTDQSNFKYNLIDRIKCIS